MLQVTKTINNNKKCSKEKQTILIEEVSESTAIKNDIALKIKKP